MTVERTTKYSAAVREFMARAGHATNGQILAHLQRTYPELSATTVHRITARMLERGELAAAPDAADHAARFDAELAPHDHFQCRRCDRLRDVVLPADMFERIQAMMGDCRLNGRLTVQGACNKCLAHTEEL